MTYCFPENFFYADSHEYFFEDGALYTVGLSEYAVDQLGDIVFVELEEKGSILDKGATFGTIESVKAVEEVYMPFNGEIMEINSNIVENPEILQNSPNNDGWLIKIKASQEILFDNFYTSQKYSEKVDPK